MTEGEAIVEAYDKGRELGRSEATNEIERLRAALRSWHRSNYVMEWLDDDSPLVRQTRDLLGYE